MRKLIPVIIGVGLVVVLSTTAYAQLAVGGAGGAGLGDQFINYFYQNFMHALAALGLLACLVGAMVMRSHIMEFAVVGISLMAIGNYQAILALAGF
jgi:hypothetical protein